MADNRVLAFVQWDMELPRLNTRETNLVNPDFARVAGATALSETVDFVFPDAFAGISLFR